MDFEVKSLSSLDWFRILDRIEQRARTELAKKHIRGLESSKNWFPSMAEGVQAQKELEACLSLGPTLHSLAVELEDLRNPLPPLEWLKKNGVLYTEDAYTLFLWIKITTLWKKRDMVPHWLSSPLPDLSRCYEKTKNIFSDSGEVSESATPELKRIYQKIYRKMDETQEKLHQVSKDLYEKGHLRSPLIDKRNGHYVLPVISSQRQHVGGTVWDSSQTDRTYFVEPQAIQILDQELRELEVEKNDEIRRILSEVSSLYRSELSSLETSIETFTHWDVVFAKTFYTLEIEGKPIHHSAGHEFKLQETAHPYLWFSLPKDKIQKNTFVLERPKKAVLFSGPNTGGKTVFLKTIALSAISLRTGLGFPSSHPEGCSVPWFDQILSDLGDLQSVEDGISSFSGHLYHMMNIFARATSESLVLFDELGTATDPEEGSALGRASLEHIIPQAKWTFITTHDSKLKLFSEERSDILNASMLFHEETQTPTYQVILGIPGRSRALETAKRVGFPQTILQRSKELLSTQHHAFEDRLKSIDDYLLTLQKETEKTKLQNEELERTKKKLEQKIKVDLHHPIHQMKQKISEEFETTLETLRQKIVELDQMKKPNLLKVREDIRSTEDQFHQNVDSILQSTEEEEIKNLKPSSPNSSRAQKEQEDIPLEVGAQVFSKKWNQIGTVLEIAGDEIFLSFGLLKAKVHPLDLTPIKTKKTQRVKTHIQFYASDSSSPELDLRGMETWEAKEKTLQFLDQVYRERSHTLVRIIHGHGEGKLKKTVRAALRDLHYVKTFEDAPSSQGGSGATQVTLDRYDG